MPPDPSVPRETRERLEAYERLLRLWNDRVNLVSRGDMARFRDRHLLDALQLAPLMPAGVTRAIDLGSGAGLPGLVLAIRTGVAFTLVEADQRKAAFLREAARLTAAPVIVLAERAERVAAQSYPLVTARALAALPELLALAERFIGPDTVCLFPKGATAEGELTRCAPGWHMQVERIASRTEPRAVILRITSLQRV